MSPGRPMPHFRGGGGVLGANLYPKLDPGPGRGAHLHPHHHRHSCPLIMSRTYVCTVSAQRGQYITTFKHFNRCPPMPRHEHAQSATNMDVRPCYTDGFWCVVSAPNDKQGISQVCNMPGFRAQEVAHKSNTILFHISLTSSLHTAMAPRPACTHERK
jgi:hypothetical protein